MLGVPLGIVHLLNAAFVFGALFAGARGSWDDQSRAGVGAMCLVSVSLSVLGTAITLVPDVRRAMGLWWLAPPLALGLIAAVRGQTLG